MAYEGEIVLDESMVKNIILKQLKKEGYKPLDGEDSITINISKSVDGGPRGYQPPRLSNVKVKVEV